MATNRSLERWDGLATVGEGRIGALSVRTPEIARAARSGDRAETLRLDALPAPSGTRRLRLSHDGGELVLDLPILAPEILGAPDGALTVAPGVLLVHAPWPADPPPAVASPPELLVLGNARTLWADGLPFVRAVRAIRERWGSRPLLWAPRVALPNRVALLAYLGVDLLDDTEGRLAGRPDALFDPLFGTLDASAAGAEGWYPEVSGAAPPQARRESALALAYDRALSEVRVAARSGRLRELVESRQTSEPVLAEMLRYADRELGGLLEERAPIATTVTRGYVLAESFRRPEMARFRDRLRERYRPPSAKRVLLLVPCSRTKPYRASRSHRRFASALDGLAPIERLHVVSVSAPIGVVPRELEDVPPARHYDIPVTGDWSEPEREAVLRGLEHLVSAGAYRSAIVHLDPREYGFVAPALERLPNVRWTLTGDRTTSAPALEQLRAGVGEALAGEGPAPGGPLAVVREELAEVASVQFGRAAAERLFAPPVRLAGRPWFQRVTDGRSDLATLREERGLFFLTVAGARRWWPEPPLWVDIDPGLSLAGDLFAPGVRDADPSIRAGDSVVLRRGPELAGVGEAVLPGRMMRELDRGLAVRVRHRAGPATDTALTEVRPRAGAGPVV